MPRLPRHLTRLAAALTLAVTVAGTLAGCSALTPQTPKPTPTDFAGIVAELAREGVTVANVTSADAGCDDQRLARTAIGFDASGAGQEAPIRVHLYAFKTKAIFSELRAAVDLCARSFVTDPAAYSTAEATPYIFAGNGPWPAAFREALQRALGRAAVGG